MDRIDCHAECILKKVRKDKNFKIKAKDLPTISYLHNCGYIANNPTLNEVIKDPNSTKHLSITTEGITYLSSAKNEDMRYYVPLFITTFFSALSLLISIFSLCNR